MAKLLSILLSSLILIQSFDIDINDISQLDELIEHAQFHSEKYGDNILVFLSKHYGELKELHDKDHQEEKKNHEKLPFQHQCNCASIAAIVLSNTFVEIQYFQISKSKMLNYYYQEPTSSLHTQGFFQPPQLA